MARHVFSFWVIGLLNNIPYVIMIAGAKNISEGGTALVFIANILPSLIVKISSPYWFDKVGYRTRIKIGSILMAASFFIVALFSRLDEQYPDNEDNRFNISMQLLGVACGSAQGGLGEATLLALSGKADSFIQEQNATNTGDETADYRAVDERDNSVDDSSHGEKESSICITAFSSGTGFAGVSGFLYIFICNKLIGLSLPMTLVFAMVFPFLYWFIFLKYLHEYTTSKVLSTEIVNHPHGAQSNEMIFLSSDKTEDFAASESDLVGDIFQDDPDTIIDETSLDVSNRNASNDPSPVDTAIASMTTCHRCRLVLSLWPYMLPLFVVYAAEYALQSGVWTAIGFPVDDKAQRDSFYVTSNWVYQVGVFVSRSSGAFFTAPMWLLWLMPILQVSNLIIFYFIATYHFWYNNVLLLGSFYVGLLGGAVYVHGYSRINKDVPIELREFALSSASVADGMGIVLADISGLFIQACLYKSNFIGDSTAVSCPAR